MNIDQPFRLYVVLYLVTNTVVQFFVLRRFSSFPLRFSLVQTPVYQLLGAGRDLLWALYQCSENDLDYGLPSLTFSGHSVSLTGVVGIGSSAIVYSADVVGCRSPMVVKHFKADHLHKLATEAENHDILREYALALFVYYSCAAFVFWFVQSCKLQSACGSVG